MVAWSPWHSVPRLLPLAPGFAPTYGPWASVPASLAFGPWTCEHQAWIQAYGLFPVTLTWALASA
ncbi:MAG: hypothetical protein DWI69_14020 [Chloroflexi bacterium]|nr:MAG: hypothetical protein DWI69_14020 [Chloroflexota bacterium]